MRVTLEIGLKGKKIERLPPNKGLSCSRAL